MKTPATPRSDGRSDSAWILAPFASRCKRSDFERYRRRAERQHEASLASGDVEVESVYAALVEELRR